MFRRSVRVKASVSRDYASLCVLCPHNRMLQTILIVFSLWILLSYANWAVSEALPKSKKEDLMVYWDFGSRLQHDLENITLEPRPGHGTIAQRPTGASCGATRRIVHYAMLMPSRAKSIGTLPWWHSPRMTHCNPQTTPTST